MAWPDRVQTLETLGEMNTADHKDPNEDQESRVHYKYAWLCKNWQPNGSKRYPCKTKSAQETMRSLRKFLHPEENPRSIHTNNSVEFITACDKLNRNHERSTPHRSETHGIAERAAVRRVKEGTSSVLVQSGLQESWWAAAVEMCKTY